MVLDTVESIAAHIATKWVLPIGVSGALVDTVSLNRIKVQNFVGTGIDANAIPETYQDIITDFSKADALEEAFAWASTVSTSGGAVIVDSGTSLRDSRKLGDMDVKSNSASQTSALNFLTSLSINTPTKLRETARASMEDLGRETLFYKANG
jgi:hypothetical protein